MMPNKQTFLDISTGHLSGAAKRWLDEGAELNLLASQENGPGAAMGCLGATMYGWFMHAGADAHHGMPPELEAICLYAVSNGCQYILFDADAEVVADLPVYDFGDVPVPPEVVETPPQDVYYHDGNFYSAETQKGMGNDFYFKWRDRASEFRSRPDKIDAGIADELAEPAELDEISEAVRRHQSGTSRVQPEAEVLASYRKIAAGMVEEVDAIIIRLSRLRASLVNQSH